MTLIKLLPDFEIFEPASIEDQSWIIARDYGICNGWRVNFALDVLGNTNGDHGDSLDVSSDIDRALLGKLRSLSDVIVTSGETARVEKYKSSRHAPIAIFTRSGALDRVPAIQGTQYFTPLVLTPKENFDRVADSLADVDARILGFEQTAEAWPSAIASIIQHEGFQSPILESGPQTVRQFLQEFQIAELCFSVTSSAGQQMSARGLSRSHLETIFGDLSGFHLSKMFVSERTVFMLWKRDGVAAAISAG